MAYDCPVSGYGLYLNKKETKAFMEKYLNKTEITDDDISDIETKLFQDSQVKAILITRTVDFHLNVETYFEVCKTKNKAPRFTNIGKEITEDNTLFFETDKQGSLFETNDETSVYRTKEEFINEFKEKIGEFLPDNFDYIAHLAYCRGNC